MGGGEEEKEEEEEEEEEEEGGGVMLEEEPRGEVRLEGRAECPLNLFFFFFLSPFLLSTLSDLFLSPRGGEVGEEGKGDFGVALLSFFSVFLLLQGSFENKFTSFGCGSSWRVDSERLIAGFLC